MSDVSVGVRRFVVLFGPLLLAGSAIAQQTSPPTTPYARIDPSKTVNAGPDRASARDVKGAEIKIGLMLPLEGPGKAEGQALLAAARMAVEDAAGVTAPRVTVAVGDESGPWSRASSEIARLMVNENVVAVVTASDGRVAHLAEQIGNKLGTPVVTLASDPTTTEINLPWIFRLSADDTAQAEAFARAIYVERGLKNVVLVAGGDHDGLSGAGAFMKAVTRFGLPAPEIVNLGVSTSAEAIAGVRNGKPQAVVMWADAHTARALLPALASLDGAPPVFLSTEAAEAVAGLEFAESVQVVSRSGADARARARFERNFDAVTGHPPTAATAAIYDAIQLVVNAVRQTGPNRARLRDRLAATHHFAGVSGEVNFDGAGNNLATTELIALQPGRAVAVVTP